MAESLKALTYNQLWRRIFGLGTYRFLSSTKAFVN